MEPASKPPGGASPRRPRWLAVTALVAAFVVVSALAGRAVVAHLDRDDADHDERRAPAAASGVAATAGPGGRRPETAPAVEAVGFAARVERVLRWSRAAHLRSTAVLAGMRAKTYDPTRALPDARFALARHGTALARARALSAPGAAARTARARLVRALERAVSHDRDVLGLAGLYGTEDVVPFAAALRRATRSAEGAARARRAFLAALDRLRTSAGLGPSGLTAF